MRQFVGDLGTAHTREFDRQSGRSPSRELGGGPGTLALGGIVDSGNKELPGTKGTATRAACRVWVALEDRQTTPRHPHIRYYPDISDQYRPNLPCSSQIKPRNNTLLSQAITLLVLQVIEFSYWLCFVFLQDSSRLLFIAVASVRRGPDARVLHPFSPAFCHGCRWRAHYRP